MIFNDPKTNYRYRHKSFTSQEQHNHHKTLANSVKTRVSLFCNRLSEIFLKMWILIFTVSLFFCNKWSEIIVFKVYPIRFRVFFSTYGVIFLVLQVFFMFFMFFQQATSPICIPGTVEGIGKFWENPFYLFYSRFCVVYLSQQYIRRFIC